MKKTIAFQGSIGANSDLACHKFYPSLAANSYPSFANVFSAVEKGEVDYGMIPLENSYAGRVSEIHNLLQNSKVSIVAEHFFSITHNLAGLAGSKLDDVKEVFSHPQALMQCQNNLQKLSVKLREFSNTADAAKFVAESGDKSLAALCSEKAAKINNLQILQENMQDSGADNVTIFVVIAKNAINPNVKISAVITTLLFSIKNITGGLYKALGSFATNGVNMLKLESYIPGGMSQQAKFFITIEGHPEQAAIAAALEELKFFSTDLKVLGVYFADEKRLLPPSRK